MLSRSMRWFISSSLGRRADVQPGSSSSSAWHIRHDATATSATSPQPHTGPGCAPASPALASVPSSATLALLSFRHPSLRLTADSTCNISSTARKEDRHGVVSFARKDPVFALTHRWIMHNIYRKAVRRLPSTPRQRKVNPSFFRKMIMVVGRGEFGMAQLDWLVWIGDGSLFYYSMCGSTHCCKDKMDIASDCQLQRQKKDVDSFMPNLILMRDILVHEGNAFHFCLITRKMRCAHMWILHTHFLH